MKPVTIPCYDRYAPLRRLALGGGLVLGLTIGALMALPSQAAQVQTLPRVEVHGHRLRVEQLPPVLVSGRHVQGGDTQLARADGQGQVAAQ